MEKPLRDLKSVPMMILTTKQNHDSLQSEKRGRLIFLCKICRFISYLSSLLDQDDRSVRIAAGEALALVFEIGGLEKFSAESKGSSNVSGQCGSKSKGLVSIEGLRTEILNQVTELSVEAGGKGTTKKDLNSQRNLFKDILEFLEVFFPFLIIFLKMSASLSLCNIQYSLEYFRMVALLKHQ